MLSKIHRTVGTCLGFDPGKINFAFGTYDKNGIGNHGDAEGVEHVMLLPYFRQRLWRKMKRYRHQVQNVFIERYHMRPNSAGAIINMELANLMIGIVYEQCARLKVPCSLVSAAAHKSWAYKHLDVPTKVVTRKGVQKEEYQLHLCPDYIHLPTEHEVDAVNIARYGYEKLQKEMENDAR